MPVARATQFHRDYSGVMRVLDRLDPGERNQVESAINTLFSLRSDQTGIRLAPSSGSRRSTQAYRPMQSEEGRCGRLSKFPLRVKGTVSPAPYAKYLVRLNTGTSLDRTSHSVSGL